MTKEQSTIIKGIAILMMLWGHLFSNVELTQSLINILPSVNGIPLASWICGAMPPVPFFLFLSGYGMYIVNSKKAGDAHRYSRLVHLYVVFWTVLAVFVSIGHFVKPDEYPGSWIKILGNVSGIEPSYNTAMWFLVPYVLLALSAQFLIKLFCRHKVWLIIGVVYVLSTTVSFWISRNTVMLNHYRLLYIVAEYFALITPFMIGIFSAKYNVFKRLKGFFQSKFRCPNLIASEMLMALIFLKLVIPTSLVTSPYVFGFVALWSVIDVPGMLGRPLYTLGRYSMTMWMIHSYFYAYLFHDFIYGFKSPVLIFIVLVIVSLLTSLLLQPLGDKIFQICRQAYTYAKKYLITDSNIGGVNR